MAGWRGLPAGDLSIPQAPLISPMGVIFAGRGGAVSGPVRRRFIFRGEVWGRISGCRCSQRGRSARSGATNPRADFLMPAAPGVSTTRSRTSGLGLSQKPEHLGTAFPPSQYDLPGKFPILREDSQFKLYLQGFLYTNHLEKLAKGRIVAR